MLNRLFKCELTAEIVMRILCKAGFPSQSYTKQNEKYYEISILYECVEQNSMIIGCNI